MIIEEKQHKQLEEQKKWKDAFAAVVLKHSTNPQIEEWKTAFQEILDDHCRKVQVKPKPEVWTAAFQSVINSWKVNPASTLATVLQQISLPQTKLIQSPLPSIISKSNQRKKDWLSIKDILNSNNISCFYHFTDSQNLNSIKLYGGLYSWYSCEKKGIDIPHPGGSPNSRMLDSLYNLQDYVRLSFCDDHPMAFRHKQDGADLVLLKISADVAYQQDTLFSNINATANGHSVGGTLSDLKKVDFCAVKKHYVSRNDTDFALHQAECMVKSFIPIKYILNIDNPDRM